jgi:histidinol phosphatase-like enzyme
MADDQWQGGYGSQRFRQLSQQSPNARMLQPQHQEHNANLQRRIVLEEGKIENYLRAKHSSGQLSKAKREHNLSMEKKIGRAKRWIKHFREEKYQLCHRIPNSILAAATRFSGVTKAQMSTLIHFGCSADNLSASQSNNAHSAMERFLEKDDVEALSRFLYGMNVRRSEVAHWKGGIILNAFATLYSESQQCATLVLRSLNAFNGYMYMIGGAMNSAMGFSKATFPACADYIEQARSFYAANSS